MCRAMILGHGGALVRRLELTLPLPPLFTLLRLPIQPGAVGCGRGVPPGLQDADALLERGHQRSVAHSRTQSVRIRAQPLEFVLQERHPLIKRRTLKLDPGRCALGSLGLPMRRRQLRLSSLLANCGEELLAGIDNVSFRGIA